MAQAGPRKLDEKPLGDPVLPPKRLRLLLLRHSHKRREGSLAAALVQSMALAVISTAGAYPSWVLVTHPKWQVVLGASWAINQADPPRDSALLGPSGGALMLAIASCCLCSVVTGASAIAWDFMGRRKWRRLGPVLHCLTALLITCAAALGSSLLGVVRGRTQAMSDQQPLKFATTPGQSLFLSFLAGALASTASGLSCSSPALVAPGRSSHDLGRPARRSSTNSEESPAASPKYFSWEDNTFFDSLDLETTSSSQDEDERPARVGWYGYLQRELAQVWQGRPPPPQQQQQQQPALGGEERSLGPRREPAVQEEEGAVEKPWEPMPLPEKGGIQRELALLQYMMEDAIYTRQPWEKEEEQEGPGRGDAELQPPLASESQRVKRGEKTSQTSESQAADAGLVESQEREKQDSLTIAI